MTASRFGRTAPPIDDGMRQRLLFEGIGIHRMCGVAGRPEGNTQWRRELVVVDALHEPIAGN